MMGAHVVDCSPDAAGLSTAVFDSDLLSYHFAVGSACLFLFRVFLASDLLGPRARRRRCGGRRRFTDLSCGLFGAELLKSARRVPRGACAPAYSVRARGGPLPGPPAAVVIPPLRCVR